MGSLYNFIFYIHIYIYIYILFGQPLLPFFCVFSAHIWQKTTVWDPHQFFAFVFSPPFSTHSQATGNCFLLQTFFPRHFLRRYQAGGERQISPKILLNCDLDLNCGHFYKIKESLNCKKTNHINGKICSCILG